MNHAKAFQSVISKEAKLHWKTFNSMRLDYADGSMPENNPVNFYFYCTPEPTGDGEFSIKLRYVNASKVPASDIDFYDGLVLCDRSGTPTIVWAAERRQEEALAARADELQRQTPVLPAEVIHSLEAEFLAAESKY